MRKALVVALSSFLACNLVPALGFGAGEEVKVGAAAVTCAEAVESDRMEEALAPCRAELAADPDSLRLTRLTARAEFAEGDPARSAELWQRLLDAEGWTDGAARGQAMALWRAGDTAAAEAALRQRVERDPGPGPRHDLVDFLLGFDRLEEADELAAAASVDFPDNCIFYEDRALAAAALGEDGRAVELIAKSVATGCEPYQWATRGVLANRADHPAYRPLLDPAALVRGMDKLDDRECVQRLRLLKPVLTPAQAPAVTNEILNRRTVEVRMTGLGLLASLGARAAGSFATLLASDDLILRKRTLRELRELRDPAFIPLLEEHLEREPLPGNRALTALALGQLLLGGERAAKGEAILLNIPADQPVYPVARLVLAARADAAGDADRARTLVNEARTAEPTVFVDRDLLERLGLPLTHPTPTPEPEATLEAASPEAD